MQITSFIRQLKWADIPSDVQHMARRCVLDQCATLVAGHRTALSQRIRSVAAATFGGDEATLPLDGRRVSTAGAALATGSTIDAMDMHDGYRPAKGHAGANVFPAALALGEALGWHGEAFMTALVTGYEVALRAAVALHRTACDYHTSGAWGALGAAAVTARAYGLSNEQTRHALGIAEYHGPRSQMMRCIDYPTMLKDGSGWGGMAGVVAGRLAKEGFSGAPALTVEDDSVSDLWTDLGERWRMLEQYFKPYACCRWAQPAVEGARQLVAEHQLAIENIDRIVVYTFAAASRLAATRPANTEEAQYSLPYPVAATLIHERLDPAQVMPPTIHDENVLALADRVEMRVDDALETRFPEEALAQVEIRTTEGEVVESGVSGARGGPSDPLSDEELLSKFERLAGVYLSETRVNALRRACWECHTLTDIRELSALLAQPSN